MEQENKSIAALVVTCNRLTLLKQCVEHLHAQSCGCDILIVDNASSDGTAEWLRTCTRTDPGMHVFRQEKNIGGAGGFNYGLRRAVELGYRYTWLMDDDCLPQPDALEQLMLADARLGGPANYGFLSGTVLWTDGHECVMNRQVPDKRFHTHIELLQYGILQIRQATFVSMLVPTETVLEFGLPIADYFIWGDDIEYTRRIALRGGKASFLVGKSIAVHAMSSNVGSSIASDDPARLPRYVLAYRNEAFTYRKQGFIGVCTYLGRCAKGLGDILINGKDHKAKRCGALLKGFLKGIVFHPAIEYIGEK